MEKETYDILVKYVNWEKLSCSCKISAEFIREFQDKVEWFLISHYHPLASSADFVREFKDKVEWKQISRRQTLSEDFIREFQDKVDWEEISDYQKLSEDFIREFQDKVDWEGISYHQKLSEDFIREFQDKVDWKNISYHQDLSEDFIREFKDKVAWINISYHQKLSENFIREFQDSVYWNVIGKLVRLSEDFIREFQDRINWTTVGKYPGLSAEFIREFKYDLPREAILYVQENTPEDMKAAAADPLTWYSTALVENSTLANIDPANVIKAGLPYDEYIPGPAKFTMGTNSELIRVHIGRIRATDKVLKLLKTEYKASGKGDQGPRRSAIDALIREHRQARAKDIQYLANLGYTKYLKQLPKEF